MTSSQSDFGFPANMPILKGQSPFTIKEEICLKFLSDKMEATAEMVGVAIVAVTKQRYGRYQTGHRYCAIGAMVLGRLKKRGLVTRVAELNAWRLTMEGRGMMKQLGVRSADE